MNSSVYRSCAVPQCNNTSIKTPNKLFVFVPQKKTIRNKWLKLARRDSTGIVPTTHIYFCEDHFDLPNDMENYMEYYLMGSISRIRMRPGCFPTKFVCQPDRRKRTSNSERPYFLKKQRRELIKDYEKDLKARSSVTGHLNFVESSVNKSNKESEAKNKELMTMDNLTQVHRTSKFRSKAIETEINLVHLITSPLKEYQQSVSTAPLKFSSCVNFKSPQKLSKKSNTNTDNKSDSDDFYTPSNGEALPISVQNSTDSTELILEDKKPELSKFLEYTLLKIVKSPRSYIGVPKSCYYLIDIINEKTGIPVNHILLCLKKIRLNNSFRELADDFAITLTCASKIFKKYVPIIASYIRLFLAKLDKKSIQKNLPMAFRHKYYSISCIIDCLEIEIDKPSNALNQSLSWSEYKKANTIKYLVSCTPNGLVSYISPGYGGRISDTLLVESCDFILSLQPGMHVLADREFKHVEQYFQKYGVQLVRVPSVTAGNELSKEEARQIVNLRMHIERVIRRLSEFSMLKPHACVNHNLVSVLNNVITIACGLINLQDI